ncbi:hypothetical protein PCAR4_720103 [Paraburkholderia caribensis]|nr:hypothetical protein PCAR4_720103 [Paraburkholderia caribensis]
MRGAESWHPLAAWSREPATCLAAVIAGNANGASRMTAHGAGYAQCPETDVTS